MRRMASAAFGLAFVLVAPAASGAQAPERFESCEEAFEKVITPDPFAVDCIEDSSGAYLVENGRDFGGPSPVRNEGSGPGMALSAVLVVGFLWSVVPAFWAASLASDRGESVGMAVILALALGWAGLAIFYFMTNGRTSKAAPARRIPSPETASPSLTEGRLRELEHLRDSGILTDDDYSKRRRSILDEI